MTGFSAQCVLSPSTQLSFLSLPQEPCLWWEERIVDQTTSGHEEGTSRILLQVGSLCLWWAVWDSWAVALVSSSLEQLRMLENKLWKGLALLCCGGSVQVWRNHSQWFSGGSTGLTPASECNDTDQETGFKLVVIKYFPCPRTNTSFLLCLRFWQARAVESFLRGTTSYADQMFLLKRGLLEVNKFMSGILHSHQWGFVCREPKVDKNVVLNVMLGLKLGGEMEATQAASLQ